MGDSTEVRIPENVLCRAHWLELVPEHEPADVTWQARYAVACTTLFEHAVVNPRIQAAAGYDTVMLTAVLAQRAPLCCFLGPTARAAAAQAITAAVARIRSARDA